MADHAVYAANGRHVVHIDIRKDIGLEAVVDSFRVNTDEINSLNIDSSGSWIAASDDGGEIQVISLSRTGISPIYKTLRKAHNNICCAASFRTGEKLEIISGGLDCRLVRWNVTRLRVVGSLDVGLQQMSGKYSAKFCRGFSSACIKQVAKYSSRQVKFGTLP